MTTRAPILALKDVRLQDGPVMLFDGVDLALDARVRACLVGRNGAGKSTLMRILIGEIKCVAAKHQLFYSANPKHARYGLSVEYYTQIQVLMEVFDLEAADVIVHTKAATQVTRFGRNRAFWAEDLLPALDHAFQTLFLTRLLERAEGRESPPQARPAPSVSSLFAGEGDEGTAAAAAVASGPPAARPGRRPVVAAAQLPASWWTSAPLPLSTAPSTAKK